MRLDIYLVENNISETRSRAKQLIEREYVRVNGVIITKAGFDVKETDNVKIVGEFNPFVSKGGLKLQKALDEFKLSFNGTTIIDIGTSTGGFTDCALKAGAKKVYAIDVGHGQLHKSLIDDNRIILYEDLDFRNLDENLVLDAKVAVADVSFISLKLLLSKLKCLNVDYLIFLIKPQFECGISVAKKSKGVIKNKNVHISVLNDVLSSFNSYGFICTNLTFSPITGGDGNIEYIAKFDNLNLRKGNIEDEKVASYYTILKNIDTLVQDAFKNFASK